MASLDGSRSSPESMFDESVIAEMRRQFDAADADGSGELDADEACKAFAQYCNKGASEEEIRKTADGLRNQLDADRSATISFKEYCYRFGRKYQIELNAQRRSAKDDKAENTPGSSRDSEKLKKEWETLRAEREKFEREKERLRQEPARTNADASTPSRQNTAETNADASTPPRPPLGEGVRVKIHGLRGAPELNGQSGVVRRFDVGSSRFVVELDNGGDHKSLKADNITPVTASPSQRPENVFEKYLEQARKAVLKGIAHVQAWLSGYELWQIGLGVAIIVLFLAAWLQLNSRYPSVNKGVANQYKSSEGVNRGKNQESDMRDFDRQNSGRHRAETNRETGESRGRPRNRDFDDDDWYADTDSQKRQQPRRQQSYESDYGYSQDHGYEEDGGGLLGSFGGLQWYLVVGGLIYACWKGIIPIHRMSMFELMMVWNMIQPLLMGGRGGGRMPFGGFGRRRRGFF